MQKKMLFNMLTLSMLGVLTIACTDKPQTSNKSVSQPITSHPMDMLRQDVGSEVPTLDPAKAEDVTANRVVLDLFAGLVDFDQQNNPIPGMASSWSRSPDGKTYTFHLRPGLKFSDGSAITANDFVYSWHRLVDPKTASNYNFLLSSVVNAQAIMQKKLDPSALGVSATDALTFVVKLSNPDPSFLREITLPNAFVVPQKVIEKYGDSWTDPDHIVTSGAYTLKEHVVNGYILAVKNPYFYESNQVAIQQVKYLPYEDKNVSISAYKAGELDLTFKTIPADQYLQLKKEYTKQVYTVQQEGFYYYNFNMKDPLFANNIKLRQALSMAVDRTVLAKDVLKMGQQPLYSVVTSTIDDGAYKQVKYGWESLTRAEQIDMARRLYAEAGYGPGKELTLDLVYDNNDLRRRMAVAISSMWAEVLGVKVKLSTLEWKTWLQTMHNGNFQVVSDDWVADYNGVSTYTPLYQCNGPQNNSHSCNMQYDNLINQAVQANSRTEQIKLYKAALAIALDDYTTIPLVENSYQQMVKPYVKGYDPTHNYLEHVQSKWMHF